MGYRAWPARYLPPTIKPQLDPSSLFPIRPSLSDQKELEDMQASFSKMTQHIGMQLVEAQDAYLRDCASKLGLELEELVKIYELESRLKDPLHGGPRPIEENEYKLVYEFRLVPRRT